MCGDRAHGSATESAHTGRKTCDQAETAMREGFPGSRPSVVVDVLEAPHCSMCRAARWMVQRVLARLNNHQHCPFLPAEQPPHPTAPFPRFIMRTINIEDHRALRERYQSWIPVIRVNGEDVMQLKVDGRRLRQALTVALAVAQRKPAGS